MGRVAWFAVAVVVAVAALVGGVALAAQTRETAVLSSGEAPPAVPAQQVLVEGQVPDVMDRSVDEAKDLLAQLGYTQVKVEDGGEGPWPGLINYQDPLPHTVADPTTTVVTVRVER